MKRQKRELVYKGSILDIYKDTMQFANGKTEEWDFVSHRKGAAAEMCIRDRIYIIPNLLMICCVYTITAVIFKNPLPAAPILFLHIIYSNMLTMKNDCLLYTSRCV